jgi:phosphoglycerate dehydrogenase-like enzyme
MRHRILLPDGEIADEVKGRAPELSFTGFGEALATHDLSSYEFYVPPYLGGPEILSVLERLPNLRIVQCLTAGVDWIQPHLAPGVMLCNARGVHEASTSELAVAAMLAWAKRIPDFVRQQQGHTWTHRRVDSLHGSRAIVLGFGAIGQATGAKLQAFGVDVVGISRTGRGSTQPLSALPSLLPNCEWLVITLPLTQETEGLVDAAILAALPDGATVVNVARGPVVCAGALDEELATGRLNAVLDVTAPEPLPPDSPLWTMANVLITPHVGGDSVLFPKLAGRLVAEQIERYLRGRPLEHVVTGTY